MSLNNFIPSVWAGVLLQNLHKNQTYVQALCNRNYEGEIRQFGDTVKINAIGAVTISDYTKNTDLSSPETLTDAQTTLSIDQAKSFNFQIDDVDKAQQNPQVMGEAMREAAYGLADATDQFIAAKYADVDSGNLIGTTGSPKTVGTGGSDSNAYALLVDAGVALDEANNPRGDRRVVVPSWFHGLLLKDDRFVSFATSDSAQTRDEGLVGRAAGFAIYVSNNVPNTTGAKYRILAGSNNAMTYAEQINEVEPYRPEKRFADAVKGLHLYGAKLVRPKSLVCVTASKGTL